MGSLKDKEIKKLVKAVKENIADSIEQEAISLVNSGKSVDFRVEIEMGDGATPDKNIGAVTECYWICYTINGVRYCFQFCV